MSKYGGYSDEPLLAELYDLVPAYTKRQEDIAFYLENCLKAGGNILELGCGTGRILIPVAEAGGRITGLDISDNMLARCRSKLGLKNHDVQNRVGLVQGDMTDFRLEDSFRLVIIPFHAFQHMITPQEQMACLRNINDHLNINDKLIFDVYHVQFKKLRTNADGEEVEDTPRFALPDGRKLRRTHRVSAMHWAEQTMEVEMIYHLTDTDGATRRMVLAFPFRFFFRYEIEHLLARCGFEIIELYGSFNKTPLNDNSLEMIFYCQKIREVNK